MNEFDRAYLDHIRTLTRKQYLLGMLASVATPLVAVALIGDLGFISLVPIAFIPSLSPRRMLRKVQSEAAAVLVCLSDSVTGILNRLSAIALGRAVSQQLVALAVLASAYLLAGGSQMEIHDVLYSLLLLTSASAMYAFKWAVYSHMGDIAFQAIEAILVAALCVLPILLAFDQVSASAAIVSLCAILAITAWYLSMRIGVNNERLLMVI